MLCKCVARMVKWARHGIAVWPPRGSGGCHDAPVWLGRGAPLRWGEVCKAELAVPQVLREPDWTSSEKGLFLWFVGLFCGHRSCGRWWPRARLSPGPTLQHPCPPGGCSSGVQWPRWKRGGHSCGETVFPLSSREQSGRHLEVCWLGLLGPGGRHPAGVCSPIHWVWVRGDLYVTFQMCELFHSCSVVKSCLTFCDPMDCSTPGFSVLHHLLEFAQTHVPWISDAIQPSHPLLSPSPPAFNLSQHQGFFQWASSLHQVNFWKMSWGERSKSRSRGNGTELLNRLSRFENWPHARETKTPGWGRQQPEYWERSAQDREQLPREAGSRRQKGDTFKTLANSPLFARPGTQCFKFSQKVINDHWDDFLSTSLCKEISVGETHRSKVS